MVRYIMLVLRASDILMMIFVMVMVMRNNGMGYQDEIGQENKTY
jgi:hypothetical protein